MKTPPVTRSSQRRTFGFSRKRPTGTVKATKIESYVNAIANWMTAKSNENFATFAPAGMNCGRKVM